mmetsp:Transcript_2810/g.8797  ORF Transcript_2810/g.8797 Transcript_2810/m.8797 type:complete len:249 (+) Transcript_2810:313-1059(+)
MSQAKPRSEGHSGRGAGRVVMRSRREVLVVVAAVGSLSGVSIPVAVRSVCEMDESEDEDEGEGEDEDEDDEDNDGDEERSACKEEEDDDELEEEDDDEEEDDASKNGRDSSSSASTSSSLKSRGSTVSESCSCCGGCERSSEKATPRSNTSGSTRSGALTCLLSTGSPPSRRSSGRTSFGELGVRGDLCEELVGGGVARCSTGRRSKELSESGELFAELDLCCSAYSCWSDSSVRELRSICCSAATTE